MMRAVLFAFAERFTLASKALPSGSTRILMEPGVDRTSRSNATGTLKKPVRWYVSGSSSS